MPTGAPPNPASYPTYLLVNARQQDRDVGCDGWACGGRSATVESMDLDFSGLRATYLNCTLKRSPDSSHTAGLVDASAAIMRKHGIDVETLRPIDHAVATGVYPDMTEHGWEKDEWPAIQERVMASDILVIAGPIWLGDNSSVTKQVIERLYASSGELNDQDQSSYYGRVGGLPDHR